MHKRVVTTTTSSDSGNETPFSWSKTRHGRKGVKRKEKEKESKVLDVSVNSILHTLDSV